MLVLFNLRLLTRKEIRIICLPESHLGTLKKVVQSDFQEFMKISIMAMVGVMECTWPDHRRNNPSLQASAFLFYYHIIALPIFNSFS